MKEKAPRYLLWAIFDQEGKPVALAKARTEGGAKKKWEDNTGIDREEIHVEVVELEEGFLAFMLLR